MLSSNNYGYTDSNWKDKLTAYNGSNIYYDAIGNPISYRDGMYMRWEYGRELNLLDNSGHELEFHYNADGMRTSKGGYYTDDWSYFNTNYYYDGGQLMYERRNTRGLNTPYVIEYFYDDSGIVSGLRVNGTVYHLEKNIQGDVIAIYNNSMQVVARYSYDAWGNILSVTDPSGNAISPTNYTHIANINPIRYRSYYYDVESGFCWLQSRYYDPEVGRFINADTITDGGAGVLGNNLFMYAANNPMNNSDPSGHWIIKNAIKWIAKNVVKPVVKKVQKALSKVNATYSSGINVSGSPSAFSFNLQAGISIDTEGNVAIQGNFSGGVTGGSPGASITAYQTVTNAPNINKLEGPGCQIGGSVGVPVYGVPIAAGGDFNIIPDTNLDKIYYGATTNVGFGTPGGEFHIEWGETATWHETQFNVFDVAKGIYVKIMEW